MYGQDGVPEMAKYLREDDDKPTFDIDLDMTVTGESEPDSRQNSIPTTSQHLAKTTRHTSCAQT